MVLDVNKSVLLDAPISPGHTFGPAVEILQHSYREREASPQVLPSHTLIWDRMRRWCPPVTTVTRTVPIPTAPLGDLRDRLQASAAANTRGRSLRLCARTTNHGFAVSRHLLSALCSLRSRSLTTALVYFPKSIVGRHLRLERERSLKEKTNTNLQGLIGCLRGFDAKEEKSYRDFRLQSVLEGTLNNKTYETIYNRLTVEEATVSVTDGSGLQGISMRDSDEEEG
ncbi:CAPS2 protein, partial [Polyodon spathula]|nr:CAPS2 protein [Polyodon spathula]